MAERINLQKSFSKVNESLVKLFDESGVHRSFTVPYIDGQSMADHITSVGQASQAAGGLGANLVMTAHHSTGKGYGSGDGHTVGHGTDSLRATIVPKNDENAKAAIDAAQAHLNNIGKLIGNDDPTVKTANGQLALAKKSDGAGMNLFDFGVLITQLLHKPTQAISQVISGAKEGGHAVHLRGPGKQSWIAPEEEELSGQTEGDGEDKSQEGESQPAPEAGSQPAGAAGAAAPEAQATSASAPEAPQAQGK
jgi:hypothetical protein